MAALPRAFALAALLSGPISEPARADDPLYAKNLTPVSGLLGLPSQRGAGAIGAGRNHDMILSLFIHADKCDT